MALQMYTAWAHSDLRQYNIRRTPSGPQDPFQDLATVNYSAFPSAAAVLRHNGAMRSVQHCS